MKLISPLISTVLLLGIFTERQARPRPEDSRMFHSQVKLSLETVPYRVGPWEGTDIAQLPPAAQALLRPNAWLIRTYRDRAADRQATLMVVQCRDTRDMQGHYPPVCYPANGWEATNQATDESVSLGEMTVVMRRYEFSRRGFDREAQKAIYSFFVLPGKGFALDMDTVRQEAADYRTRSFGAAQIQVIMDAGGPQAQEQSDVVDLLLPLKPTIELLRSGPSGAMR